VQVVSGLSYAKTKISEIHDLLSCGTCGPNLRFKRDEGGSILALTKPPKRAAVAKGNATTHAPEFE
jgi:hypothetical protein